MEPRTAAPIEVRAPLSARALELAADLGFAAAGTCALGPSARADAVRRYFAQGWHGEMDYLARTVEDRIDPRRRFPWARGAVVLATPHEPPTAPPAAGAPLGERIAGYARGRDYHKVLDQRTRALGRRLAEEYAGLEWRAYVDTGPLLERELAAAAGLGWIGKNGLLLSAEMGSYLMLSVLLVSSDVEASSPALDQCGGCRRCLEACPTGALVGERLLDATKCLSYLTIERRGAFEPPDLSGYAFGCDLCQLACPYNAHAPAGDPALAPREGLDELDLAALVTLSEDEYQRRFQGSAVKRASRAGLRRNAMWLASQEGDEKALDAASACQDDPDPTVADTARAVTRIRLRTTEG